MPILSRRSPHTIAAEAGGTRLGAPPRDPAGAVQRMRAARKAKRRNLRPMCYRSFEKFRRPVYQLQRNRRAAQRAEGHGGRSVYSQTATGNSWAKEPESSVRWDRQKPDCYFGPSLRRSLYSSNRRRSTLQQPKYPLSIPCAHARRAQANCEAFLPVHQASCFGDMLLSTARGRLRSPYGINATRRTMRVGS